MATRNANDNLAGRAANVFREAVCIDTRRIYDAVSDKDCIRDLQVIFTDEGQELIDSAGLIKTRCCEVMGVYFEVAPLAFNKGFFSVDMTFFFKIVVTVCNGPTTTPVLVEGVGIFCKKVILFGSEAGVRTFSTVEELTDTDNCTPIVNVQVLDPMILASHICEEPGKGGAAFPSPIPNEIAEKFAGSFDCVQPARTLYVTLGMFSIVQLMRQVQVMIPVYDFCVPKSESDTQVVDSDPCEIFSKVEFPADDFFPPKLSDINNCD